MLTQQPASKSNSLLSEPENESIIVEREAKKGAWDLTFDCKTALYWLENKKAY